jgi:nitrite reductase/ring-hydroxylating ferredoxin subunit
MTDHPETCIGRRRVLQLLAVAAASGLATACGTSAEPMPAAPAGTKALGPLADFPPGSAKAFPDLKLLVMADDTGLWALSTECTHRNGPVSWDADAKDLVCAWHGARYQRDGTVTRGPAPDDLPRYALSLVDGVVHVDPDTSVSKDTVLARPPA